MVAETILWAIETSSVCCMALGAGTEPVPDVAAIEIVFLTDGHDSARLFVGTVPLKPSERYRSPGAISVVVADIHSTAEDRKKIEMRMNCARAPLLLNIAMGIDGVGREGSSADVRGGQQMRQREKERSGLGRFGGGAWSRTA